MLKDFQIENGVLIKYNGTEKEVVVPDSVTYIGSKSFAGCYSLTSITVDEENEVYTSIDGCLYSKDGKTLIKYASGKEERIFIVPNKVKHINNYAFEGADHLTSISIADNVISIGEEAFSSCRSLINIRTSRDNQTYKSIDGILYSKGGKQLIAYPQGRVEASFMTPESVTSINDYAFDWAWGLRAIFIGKNISFISEKCIGNCGNLMDIMVLSDNPNYKSVEGVLYSKDGKKLIRYPQGKTRNSFINFFCFY